MKAEVVQDSVFVQLLISSLAVLAPIKPVLIVTGILIFADLVSGVLAARKKGEKISSAGVRRTVSKVLIYNAAIILGFLIEKYMLDSYVPISKIVAGLIGTTEGLSIYENLNALQGQNMFKKVLSTLGSSNDSKDSEESKS